MAGALLGTFPDTFVEQRTGEGEVGAEEWKEGIEMWMVTSLVLSKAQLAVLMMHIYYSVKCGRKQTQYTTQSIVLKIGEISFGPIMTAV